LTIPNYITLFRILLVPFFFTSLVSYEPGSEYYRWVAFGLFIAACLSDALDGILARVLNKHSELGRFLDPLADKMLLLSGYLALLTASLKITPPLWVIVTIVFRDIILISGLLILFLMTGNIRIKSNMLGKVTTAVQMITLGVILAQWKIAVPLWHIAGGVTIISCVVYVFRELNHLNGNAK